MLGWVEGSNTCRRPYRTAGPSNDLASGYRPVPNIGIINANSETSWE